MGSKIIWILGLMFATYSTALAVPFYESDCARKNPVWKDTQIVLFPALVSAYYSLRDQKQADWYSTWPYSRVEVVCDPTDPQNIAVLFVVPSQQFKRMFSGLKPQQTKISLNWPLDMDFEFFRALKKQFGVEANRAIANSEIILSLVQYMDEHVRFYAVRRSARDLALGASPADPQIYVQIAALNSSNGANLAVLWAAPGKPLQPIGIVSIATTNGDIALRLNPKLDVDAAFLRWLSQP